MKTLLLLTLTTFISLNAQAWSILDQKSKLDHQEAQQDMAMSEALAAKDYDTYLKLYEKALSGVRLFQTVNYSQKDLAGSQMKEAYFSLTSDEAPTNGRELCKILDQPYGVNQFLGNETNRMAFTNQPGTFGTGTCWWHSSLTRSAATLAIYQPTKEKPSNRQAEIILDTLISMKAVVEIPGFENWQKFSDYYSDLIESKLSAWQRREAVSFGWTRGLKGTGANSPEDMRANLDRADLEFRLYQKPVYMMLQFKGPMAHSWLVLDIKKTTTGYTLFVLDSNLQTVDRWDYQWGQPHFNYIGTGETFIPYIQPKERQDLFKLKAVTDKFCQSVKK